MQEQKTVQFILNNETVSEALLDADFQLLTREKKLAKIDIKDNVCRIGAAVTVQ